MWLGRQTWSRGWVPAQLQDRAVLVRMSMSMSSERRGCVLVLGALFSPWRVFPA